jgi:hypothetical protein
VEAQAFGAGETIRPANRRGELPPSDCCLCELDAGNASEIVMLTSRGLHLRISRWSPRLQSHQSLAIVAESRRPSLTIPQRSASFGATLHPISISAYRAGHGRIGPHQAALLRVRWSVNAARRPRAPATNRICRWPPRVPIRRPISNSHSSRVRSPSTPRARWRRRSPEQTDEVSEASADKIFRSAQKR